jgi:branched-chain amino acid transport system substrate-binding protein
MSSTLRRPFSASVFSALAVCSIVLAGCGSAGISAASRVTVYVSMPLRGASGVDGRDVTDAARLALAAAHGRAGDLRVRAVYLDDTAGHGPRARWSPARAGANARRATEDTSAVAYIGDFQSGATRTSEPITNGARLLQVSPAATAVDLVRPFPGSSELPAGEQAGGERTFGRVIPDDEAQAAAAAAWVRRLHVRRVEVVHDRSAFGRTLAQGFRESLRGVRVVDKASVVYFGGFAEPVSALQSSGSRVMASDAVLPPFAAGSLKLAALATSPAQDSGQLPPRGQRFAAEFRRRYGHSPGRYAAYGYEAMAVVLDAIRRAGDQGTDRQAVIDAFFATRNRRSILGTYSIDPIGDTTLNRLTGYRLRAAGPPQPVALLPAR